MELESGSWALGSSVNTIAFHMKSIYAKLQVHSKSEAHIEAHLKRRAPRHFR